uniref:C-type Lectin LecD n=1 Tax=Eriocheir sinensis TaxID=95602 RepID=V5JAD9_ERISI|nr:C-type Lectin LecD [Eriocheir sinensis]
MRKATLLLTATLLATASSQSCGSGFTLVGSACYLPGDSLTWQQARNYCRALDLPDGKKASLARVESCSQLHALTNHITNQGYEIADYWLGGTSALDVTGAFRWESTGALVPIGPPFWFPGQPDYAGIERTLSLSKTGLFADEGESLEQKFICQIL